MEHDYDAIDPAVDEYRRTTIARRHLPSELVHKPLLKWPGEVAALTSIPEGLLVKRHAAGDAPRLVRVGRQIFARPRDLHEWIDAHVEPA